MVKKIFNYLIVFSTFFLLLAPLIVNGEDALSSSPLKIDRHWIYIFQLDNYKTLEVNEYFYINNTGFSPYNKSLNIWIQNNSFIYLEDRRCLVYFLILSLFASITKSQSKLLGGFKAIGPFPK